MPVASEQAWVFAQRCPLLFPAAVAFLLEDLPSLTIHVRSPAEHWHRIRHIDEL